MIIAQLNGGLGNQLFQYAFGRSLALENDTKLKLDISNYKSNTDREFGLYHFDISAEIMKNKDIIKFTGYNPINILSFFFFKKFLFHNNNFKKQEQTYFRKDYLNFKKNSYLVGSWQSEKFFLKNSKVIRNELKFKNKPIGKNLEYINLVKSTNSVSIHIRRGDYVSNTLSNRIHGVCDLSYYKKAISLIKKKVNKPRFFLFSDDTNWVKNNFKLKNSYILTHNKSNSDFEDFRIMSSCKYHIIANSSFSWWAAWLSVNRNKIVIAPKKWFNLKNLNCIDIIPSDWIRI